MPWGAWCRGMRGVGVGSGQRLALRLRATPRTRRRLGAAMPCGLRRSAPACRPGAAMPWAVGAAAPLAPRCASVLQGAGTFTARLLGRRMAPLMLLSMPAVTRWGRGAGVAGARAVWRCRRDGAFQRLPCHEGGIVVAGGSRRSAAPRPRALGRFVDTGWQDSRAVHDSRGPFPVPGPLWDT